MTSQSVDQIAEKYNIDLSDLNINIDKPRMGY